MGVCVRDRRDALSSVPAQADVDSAQSEGKNMPEEVVGGLVKREGPLWGHLILSIAPPVAETSHSRATLSSPVWALGRLPGVGCVAVGCQARGGPLVQPAYHELGDSGQNAQQKLSLQLLVSSEANMSGLEATLDA